MARKLMLMQLIMYVFVVAASSIHAQEQDQLPAPENLWFLGNTLYWSEVEDADSYIAQRTHGQQRANRSAPSDSRQQMTYTDMQDGETYEFRVRAVDTSDRSRDSAWSETFEVRYRSGRCLELSSGKYIAMPDSDFLSGSPLVYEDDLCRGQRAPSGIENEHGLVHTETTYQLRHSSVAAATVSTGPMSLQRTIYSRMATVSAARRRRIGSARNTSRPDTR